MLLVNFDDALGIADLEKWVALNQSKNFAILDFTNSLRHKLVPATIKVLDHVQLDPDQKLHREALDMYINTIAGIGDLDLKENKKVRDILFDDLPVYWITSIALKKVQYSILKHYYYLLLLIEQGKLEAAADQEKVTIFLPASHWHYASAIKTDLQLKGYQAECLCSHQTEQPYSSWSPSSYLRSVLKKLLKAKAHFSNLERAGQREETVISFFTYPDRTWNDAAGSDFALKDIQTSIESRQSYSYIPLFLNEESIDSINKWHSKWDISFLEAFPGYRQIVLFVLRMRSLIRKINSLEFVGSPQERQFGEIEMLRHEFREVVYYRVWNLFYYVWLRNYLDRIKSKKILIYQDEFYQSGRIISAAAIAANNSRIKTLGVQHGLFFASHTVYSITDKEISGRNAFPLPDHFVVWGEFFKKYFLSHNSLPESFVQIGGNYKYERLKTQPSGVNKESIPTVLWCTTIQPDTKVVFDYLKNNFDILDQARIIVRCHPLFQIHNLIQELFESVGFTNFTFSSREDIIDDIQRSHLMLTSSSSTAFLDGLLGKVPVINVVFPEYLMDNLEFPNLYPAGNSQELRDQLIELKKRNFEFKHLDVDSICAPSDNWHRILDSLT